MNLKEKKAWRQGLIALLAIGLMPQATSAEGVFPLSPHWLGQLGMPELKEERRVLPQNGFEHRILSLRTPGVIAVAVERDGQWFTRIVLPGAGVSQTVGKPELPVYRKLFFFERNARVTCNASVRLEHRFVLHEHGLPSAMFTRQRPIPKVPGAMEEAVMKAPQASVSGRERSAGLQPISSEAKAASRLHVGAWSESDEVSVTRLVDLGIARGRRVVLLEVLPVAYNAKTGTMVLRESVDVEIEAKGSILQAGGQPTDENEHTFTTSLSQNPSGGEGVRLPEEENGEISLGARLLIIASNQFVPLLESFVAHKEEQGWAVEVMDTTATGATAAAIRSQIQARYTNKVSRPTHLLLAGDTDTIPAWSGNGAYLPATDLYYACMDGTNDWLPDMAYARFPARTATQLIHMIVKTIAYKNNTTTQTPFVWNAAFISSEENYTITEGTHDLVMTQHLAARGYVSRKLYRHTYGATTAAVRDTINAGCSLVAYSGHGHAQEWRDPLMKNTDVLALTNELRLPLVMSFACDTASYRDYDESFAEAWLRKASPCGAIAVLAASEDSYWYEDDTFEKALFASIFEDHETILGDVILRAKERYLAHYGPGPETLQYFEQYNLFGDPTLQLVVLEGIPVLFEPMVLSDGSFQFIVSGITGRAYTVQASTNLVDWTNLTDFVATSTVTRFQDTSATNFTRRFYRVIMR